jgi:hypothetical protein
MLLTHIFLHNIFCCITDYYGIGFANEYVNSLGAQGKGLLDLCSIIINGEIMREIIAAPICESDWENNIYISKLILSRCLQQVESIQTILQLYDPQSGPERCIVAVECVRKLVLDLSDELKYGFEMLPVISEGDLKLVPCK